MLKKSYLILPLLIATGCAPLYKPVNYGYQPVMADLSVIGAAVASDPRAERVEQLRREKGIYWPGEPVVRVSSTFIEGVFAYFSREGNIMLVDETMSYVKFGNLPWESLSPDHKSPMPEEMQRLYLRRAFAAWIGDKSTLQITLGKGHKRKFLYKSQLDCPYSARFDSILMAASKQVDVTLYAAFTMVHRSEQLERTAEKLLCAKSPQAEWVRYRSGKPLNGKACDMPLMLGDVVRFTVFSIIFGDLPSTSLIDEEGRFVDIDSVTRSPSLEQNKKELIRVFSAPSAGVGLFGI